MMSFVTAMALAAAAQAAPAAANQGTTMPTGQMDHSKMPMGQMDHSKMPMGQMNDGCCKQTANGKMECRMPGNAGATSANQGHSGR